MIERLPRGYRDAIKRLYSGYCQGYRKGYLEYSRVSRNALVIF